MAGLKSIAELAWKQLFPNPGNKPLVTRGQFVATAKTEYGYLMWKKLKEDKAQEGDYEVPSHLLTYKEMTVENNAIDISGLEVMRGLDFEMWLQDVRGVENDCSCKYVKSTSNKNKILCNDDSLPDDAKIYFPAGKKILFPRGTHANKLIVVYAGTGEGVDDDIEIDDAIGGMIRRTLIEIYGGKTGPEDRTNDQNPNK